MYWHRFVPQQDHLSAIVPAQSYANWSLLHLQWIKVYFDACELIWKKIQTVLKREIYNTFKLFPALVKNKFFI